MQMELLSSPVESHRLIRTPTQTHHVGHQSFTSANLCIKSTHNDIVYYTTRWDALCPYVDVSAELIACAKRPLIVYAVPPESPYGVPINDHYGLADIGDPGFWSDSRRARKFGELTKRFRTFRTEISVVAGKSLDISQMLEMGGVHFAKCEIERGEIEGFLDYVRDLDVLIVRCFDQNGDQIFTDVSMLLPEYEQIYGSFCQWNDQYKRFSPGIYACLAVCEWGRDNGYRHYNLGPIGDYPYKELFVTTHQPIYAIALVSARHALWKDPTSPLLTDFPPGSVNALYRNAAVAKSFASERVA